MSEMFERFMWFKKSEGLAPRTIEEYQIHFQWLLDYLDGDLSSEEMTLEVFLEWVGFMLMRGITTNNRQYSYKNYESFPPLVLSGGAH
jgi:hypothetical protein